MAPGVILLKPERIFHREAGKESERVGWGEGEGGLKAECNLTELQKSDILTHFSSVLSTKVVNHFVPCSGTQRAHLISEGSGAQRGGQPLPGMRTQYLLGQVSRKPGRHRTMFCHCSWRERSWRKHLVCVHMRACAHTCTYTHAHTV